MTSPALNPSSVGRRVWVAWRRNETGSGWEGSVHRPFAHPQPEAGERGVGGGVQGRLHSACILGVGWTPLLGLSTPICEEKPLGPPGHG